MIIEAKNISKSFGQVNVLQDINLSVKKGEIISIMGASGAGKSTLLQIISSLSRPDSGSVFINNVDIFNLSSYQLSNFRNKNMGFVFQFHHLLPEFTALENVMIPALIGKVSKKEATKKAIELLNEVGLGHRYDHKPAQLSGGEMQRVAIARALINSPDIIFADEPTGNLDSKNKKDINSLFLNLREKYNNTIVIVTHEDDLAKMCDRCLIIKDGKIDE